MKTWQIIVLAALAILIISPAAREKVMSLIPSGQAPATATDASKCYIEDTTLTLGPVREMFNPTASFTYEQYHRLYVNTVDKGLIKDGDTVEVNPGDKVEIYYAENSSTHYAAKQEFVVPCAGTVVSGSAPDSSAYKIYAHDSKNLTKRVFNEDNGNLNAAATDNETLSAGDQVNLDVQLIGTFEDAFSPYGNILMVVDANDTVYKDFAAGSYPECEVPGQYVQTNTDSATWCFELPGIKSNEELDFQLFIEVEAAQDPNDQGGSEIRIQLYDEDWYRDTDTGVETLAAETNDEADVGFGADVLIIYVA